MIDLLKNYKELRNGPGYVSSLRYYLAKKKLDVLSLQHRLSSSNGSAPTQSSSSNSSKRHKPAN
jgi:hypothetical protein